MKLYLLSLQNEKWLLHLSQFPSRALVEPKLIYEFAKLNPPIQIEEEYNFTEMVEIDFHVKRNMLKYGIENVRGGTYIDPVLPDYLVKTLEKELSLNISNYTPYWNEVSVITASYDELFHKDPCLLQYERNIHYLKLQHYQNTSYKWNAVQLIEMTNLEHTPTPTISPYSESILHLWTFNTHNSWAFTSDKDDADWGYSVCNDVKDDLVKSNNDIVINHSIFTNMEWLKMWITNWKEMFVTHSIPEIVSTVEKYKWGHQDALYRYSILARKMKTVVELYIKMKAMEECVESVQDELMLNPKCVLDLFFYVDEPVYQLIKMNGIETFLSGIENFLRIFENLCYYVLNRKAEYQHDMDSYDMYVPKFQNTLEFAVDYIDYLFGAA